MCPIDNVSEIVRMPRLGKIRLGIKEQGKGHTSPYPKAVDYFVCPPVVQSVFGEKPKELKFMFPLEDQDTFAQQWLKRYVTSHGLTCIGNGSTCKQKIDTVTTLFASSSTEKWEWREGNNCNPDTCIEYEKKRCRRVMNLQILLPDVPGLGIWQIDTSSFYSIVNINSMIQLLKGLFGRCSMLPLTLALGPVEVSPQGMKKKTVHILHVRQDDIRLAQLAHLSSLPPSRVLLPEITEDDPPDDLFPEAMIKDQRPDYILDDLQCLWGEIKEGLKREDAPDFIHLSEWFDKHYQIDICSDDLIQEYYPEFLSPTIVKLHASLQAYYEHRL